MTRKALPRVCFPFSLSAHTSRLGFFTRAYAAAVLKKAAFYRRGLCA